MRRERLSRSQAKARLAALQVVLLPPGECEEVVEDWPVCEGDPEWQTLPEDLRRELSKDPRCEGRAHLERYRPLVLAGLVGQMLGVRNDWLGAELERKGHAPVVVEGELEPLAPCPCCGFLTLSEPGQWDICAVCFWEDGGDGPNHMTLAEGRRNFNEFGACARRNIEHVLPDGPQRYPKADVRTAKIVDALIASSEHSTPVELAELLHVLTDGGLSQFRMISYFKQAFPEIPLRALNDAGGWHRLSSGGLSDDDFNETLGQWLPRRAAP